ncbi:MAG: ATP-binding protein [Clostridiales bacterium]|nr:ATP-binding protein [Clostridiales bacterium]
MTREGIILRLQQEYAARREDNLRRYEERVQAACEACEGLRPLLDARHKALMEGVRGALYPARKDPRANVGLPNTLADYNARIRDLLLACRLPADALAPVYTCPVCKDEGFLYDPTRRMCACFERELNRRALAELGLTQGQTFEAFDESCFTDEPPVSQRSLMRRNRELCLRYADSYPNTEYRDLLFTGKSGLGKTFLMQAIAHRVAQRGYEAQYISAYKMLEIMRKAYFENNSALLEPLMEAPLLLVDDLGTEPLMENITVTQFFNLMNERQNANRHTILSTNLTLPELKARYTERIASRLQDSRYCKIVKFIGEDVRERIGRAAPIQAQEEGDA